MCMCNFACKRHPWNDLYCVGWDVKPYSLTHSYGLGNSGKVRKCKSTWVQKLTKMQKKFCQISRACSQNSVAHRAKLFEFRGLLYGHFSCKILWYSMEISKLCRKGQNSAEKGKFHGSARNSVTHGKLWALVIRSWKLGLQDYSDGDL